MYSKCRDDARLYGLVPLPVEIYYSTLQTKTRIYIGSVVPTGPIPIELRSIHSTRSTP
jgi:hypothetical protein